MTLMQLKYVIAVAGQNSLNEAAKMLFISNPISFSKDRIAEERLGCDIKSIFAASFSEFCPTTAIAYFNLTNIIFYSPVDHINIVC